MKKEENIFLNLGCGLDVKLGWKNYDIQPINEHVEYINLNELPLQFEDEYADEIMLDNVLEHLTVNPHDFLKEIHRILKPQGIVTIKVPAYKNIITHNRWFFDYKWLNPILETPLREPKEVYREERKLYEVVSWQDSTLKRWLHIILPPLFFLLFHGCGEITWKLKKI